MQISASTRKLLSVLRIVLIYAFFGSLWIYFSDTLLGWLVHEPEIMTSIALVKGILFILCTSMLLSVLIFRHVRQSDKTERLLRESESRYRLLAENAHDIIFTMDPDLHFTYISPSIKRIRGLSVEEGMAQEITEVLTPDSLEVAGRIFQEEMEIEAKAEKKLSRIRTIELEEYCKDGSTIWTETTFSPIRDEKDKLIGIFGITRDISERKEAEEAIRRSEARYRAVFEGAATANIVVSEDTTIQLANSNFEAMTGYSRQELEGKMSFADFVAEEDLERVAGNHWKRRREPGSVPDSYELKFIDRKGQERNLYMSVALLPETSETIASMIDITDWKSTEKAKSESEERFRELAGMLPETMYEADRDGLFTFVNDSAYEKFGYTREDYAKKFSVFDMVVPEEHPRMVATYLRLISGEKVSLGEYTARRKDGSTFPALVHATAIFRDGKPVGHRGFVIDISEKKLLENQLMRAQKMEAIGTLAGGIAHDFNNLLMGILGNISLILMNLDETHPAHDRLKSMEEYVRHGSDLTKQLLGFARGGKYEVKPTDLGRFVCESAELFGRTKKEIRIHRKTQDRLWTVEVDRGQMEQVMLNLYVNAWQAMPGGGDLYLSEENVNLDEIDVNPYGVHPGRYVKVTVTDTGVGMDEAVKARIFEPFFTTKERGRGTGLGLASAYGIVKNHGGFIHVESEKGAGSSFMIYLPASDKEVKEDRKADVEIRKGQGTILLIDDEDMILNVGSEMLASLGYAVVTAAGGKQGIEIYEQNRDSVDLVILDMIMPGMGGKETFEGLRQRDPSVKVLLSSGYSLHGQAEEIIRSGCRGFIQKLFTLGDLSKKIRMILDGD
ncbi:MAG TPA: PAS domain S-box protein [Deltaproteobacteria bacterium]|nr:PAS domain S-box protein [Deltaproteobacteria bacterium]